LEDVQNAGGWEYYGSPTLEEVFTARHVP